MSDTIENKAVKLSDLTSVTQLIKDYTDEKDTNKVDKIEGKSLLDDTEIERLKGVNNYDDTEVKENIAEVKTDVTKLSSQIDENTNLFNRQISSLRESVENGVTNEQLETGIQKKIDEGKLSALTLGEGSVTPNILSKNIRENKMGFIEELNLFDKTTLYSYFGNGSTISNQYALSNYIPVTSGDILYTKNLVATEVEYFNNELLYLGKINRENDTIVIPNNVSGLAFVRVALKRSNIDIISISRNKEVTEVEEYGFKMPNLLQPKIEKRLLSLEKNIEKTITSDEAEDLIDLKYSSILKTEKLENKNSKTFKVFENLSTNATGTYDSNGYRIKGNNTNINLYDIMRDAINYSCDFIDKAIIYIKYKINKCTATELTLDIMFRNPQNSRVCLDCKKNINTDIGEYEETFVIENFNLRQDNFGFLIQFINSTSFEIDAIIQEMKFLPIKKSSIIYENLEYEKKEKIIKISQTERVAIIDSKDINIDGSMDVSCWGDSLTRGAGGQGTTYPDILQSLIGNHIKVKNMGVGGERPATIGGRQGGIPMIVSPFTIPSDTSDVLIELNSSFPNLVVNPLEQGDAGINPCFIENIEGKIKLDSGKYYFSRKTSGETISIKRPTPVITDAWKKNRKDITLIFMGMNNTEVSIDDLVYQQKQMINFLDYANKKYLLMSLTPSNSRCEELELRMEKEWGRNYINIRKYIMKYGLDDFGIEPTSEDITAMKSGLFPPSLMSDSIHFNSKGYTIIGTLVYKRGKELGYW